MSSAGGPKDLRRVVEKELLGQLWEGKVDSAIELLKGALEWVRNPAAVEELIAYLEKRQAYNDRLTGCFVETVGRRAGRIAACHV